MKDVRDLKDLTMHDVQAVSDLNPRYEKVSCLCFSITVQDLLRALPTETKVESGTYESKSGTSVNLGNSGLPGRGAWSGILERVTWNSPCAPIWDLGSRL